MTIKNLIKKVITYATVIATLYSGAIAQEKNKTINFGYNALETALTKDKDVRNRFLSNLDAKLGDLKVGYWGLNEVNNTDKNTYFGRNVFMIGNKNLNTQGVAVIKADKEGIFDTKLGIRNSSLVEKLRGYGFVDITTNRDAANITGFYGKELPKGISLELYQDIEIPFKDKLFPYIELQINKYLGKNLSAFGRAEIADFDVGKSTYMVGITKIF